MAAFRVLAVLALLSMASLASAQVGKKTVAVKKKATVTAAVTPLAPVIAKLKAAGQFSKFLQLLSASGAVPALNAYMSKHAVTILAPTDAAFKKLLKPYTPAQIKQLATYHVLTYKVTYAQLLAYPNGQGLIPILAIPNNQIQKFVKPGLTGVVVGPEAAQSDLELAKIVLPNVYSSATVTVFGIDRILAPHAWVRKNPGAPGRK